MAPSPLHECPEQNPQPPWMTWHYPHHRQNCCPTSRRLALEAVIFQAMQHCEEDPLPLPLKETRILSSQETGSHKTYIYNQFYNQFTWSSVNPGVQSLLICYSGSVQLYVCVYMCCLCTCMYTQLYRLFVYTYVYICECVYMERTDSIYFFCLLIRK